MESSSNSSPAQPSMQELIQNCAKEPIHIPGYIQDCGLLFVVDSSSFAVLQVSENVKDILGVPASELVGEGKFLDKILEFDEQTVEALKDQGGPVLCNIAQFKSPYSNLLVFVHPSKFQDTTPSDVMIIEAEALSDVDSMGYMHNMNKMLSRMNSYQLRLATLNDMTSVCKLFARELQIISGYDRVMLYEFDEDWHGHVVAEENGPGVPVAYYNIHFPASDIPAQARKLYTINKFRMISDINYNRVALYPPMNPRTNQPTDLTHSVFRAVSPVHVEYLRNMEVFGSFSVSITVNDKLWGLAACHHLKGPRFLPYVVRSLCFSIGSISSLHIQNIINRTNDRDMDVARNLLQVLESGFQKTTYNGITSIMSQHASLMRVFGADFGIVSIMGENNLLGTVSGQELVFSKAFVEWVNVDRPNKIIITDCIANSLPKFYSCLPETRTSGLIYVPLSLLSPCFIAFFRLEQIYSVSWAGKEEEKIFIRQGEKTASLRPRNSFKIWTEEVRSKSLGWGAVVADTSKQLQQMLSRFVEMWRAEQLKMQINQREVLMAQMAHDKTIAEESSRLKTRFMATVSHEVRTPLNAIIGMVDMTLNTELNNKQREYLTSVQFAADSLMRIVNDVLDISKIETGKVAVSNEVFNITEMVDDAVSIFRGTIERKGIDLSVEHDPNVPHFIVGDPGKIRQILSNMLANAQKYTEKGHIKVVHKLLEISSESVTVDLSVEDSGVGIPPDRLEAIFEPFEQADNSLSRKYSGAGLGLSICKQLAQAMAGKVWAESTPGEGTVFHFLMTYKTTRVPLSPNGSMLRIPGGDVRARPLRILVAEDNELNQKVLLNILQRMGHETLVAWNGEEAVQQFFKAEPPVDLVLMDLFMPVMDGITATQLIRAREPLRTPIVAVTAQCLPGDKDSCLKAGMDAYLPKPVRQTDLAETILRVTSFGLRELPDVGSL